MTVVIDWGSFAAGVVVGVFVVLFIVGWAVATDR